MEVCYVNPHLVRGSFQSACNIKKGRNETQPIYRAENSVHTELKTKPVVFYGIAGLLVDSYAEDAGLDYAYTVMSCNDGSQRIQNAKGRNTKLHAVGKQARHYHDATTAQATKQVGQACIQTVGLATKDHPTSSTSLTTRLRVKHSYPLCMCIVDDAPMLVLPRSADHAGCDASRSNTPRSILHLVKQAIILAVGNRVLAGPSSRLDGTRVAVLRHN